MKNRIITTCLTAAGLLAVATLVSVPQQTFAADPPLDPAHAAHVAAAAGQPGGQTADPQLAELRAKVQQLEAIIQQHSGPSPAAHGSIPATGTPPPAGPMGGAVSPGMSAMPGMGAGAKPAPAMAGMSGNAAPAGGGMNMMGMMDKMMGMMDKMMSMGGGAMPAGGAPMAPAAPGGMGGGMGMGMMQSEMGGMGGGAMPAAAPAAGMSGGGMGMMDMDKMEMAGMMGMMGGMSGKGGSSMAMSSALPGFPGATHIYHLGAPGFFLDHKTHIALTTEQTAALNKAKEQARLAKSSADRTVAQAEQELWMLTAADQPDAAAIEAKIREIEKARGDERLAFIRSVGEASKLLTDAQRKSLTGFAPPAPAAPMAPMKGM